MPLLQPGAVNAPLPLRDGVAPSYVWLPAGDWPNMLAFLLSRFPAVDPAVWRSRLQRSEVVTQSGAVLSASSPYCARERIFYYREIHDESRVPFEAGILYQDAHILVADKPHFLAVTPGGKFLHETLLVRLKKQTGLVDLTPLHRIDRETAGLVLFSHNAASRAAYHALFLHQAMHKTYEALTDGPGAVALPPVYRSRLEPGDPFFLTRQVDGASNAETHIELLERDGTQALYRLHPITGRKHQLRVQLSALGRPIVNDRFYPVPVADGTPDDYQRPLKLLARAIAFTDPLSGQAHRFQTDRVL